MIIRGAKTAEYSDVKDFYDNLIDHISDFEYGPKWQKDVYPAYEYIYESIEKNNMIVGLEDNKIVSAMILNTEGNESYINSKWKLQLNKGEYLVIHALGVDPSNVKKGYGKQMVVYAIKQAQGNYKSIRLDVLKGNKSANRLYESVGFELTDTIEMYYEDTGWCQFEMYEYVLD